MRGNGYHQDAAGRLYVRARYYRPDLGLWLSADPVASEPPYLYVHNAPVTLVDPAGTQGSVISQGNAAALPRSEPISAHPDRPQDIPLIGTGGGMLSFMGATETRSGSSLLSAPDVGIPPGHPAGLAYPGLFTAPSAQYVRTNDEGFLTAPTPPAPNSPTSALPQPSVPTGSGILAAGMRPPSPCNPAQEDWCARAVGNLVDQQARLGVPPYALMLLSPVTGTIEVLNRLILPQALASWAHSEALANPTNRTPVAAIQLLNLINANDAAYTKGLEEGFLTEMCETFNVANMATEITDFLKCVGNIGVALWHHPAQWQTILGHSLWQPLVDLVNSLKHLRRPQTAEEWGKLVGAILFQVVLAVILAWATRGFGNLAQAAGYSARTIKWGKAAIHAIQAQRALSAAHDPSNPCASVVVGGATIAAGIGAGKALEKGIDKLLAVQAARKAEMLADGGKQLTRPRSNIPTEGETPAFHEYGLNLDDTLPPIDHLTPEQGFFDVGIHSDGYKVWRIMIVDGQPVETDVTIAQLGELIKADPRYTPGMGVRLISCYGGVASEGGVAQRLSDYLRVDVMAADTPVLVVQPAPGGGLRQIYVQDTQLNVGKEWVDPSKPIPTYNLPDPRGQIGPTAANLPVFPPQGNWSTKSPR